MAKNDKASAIFNFKDKVNVKGDMFSGDKNIYNYGDIITNVQKNPTPEIFVQALQTVLGQITVLKTEQPAQKAEMEVVEGKIAKVVQASQSEMPNGNEIRKTLDEAKVLLESIGETATSAIGLGAILAQIAHMAITVFGG